MNVMIDMSAITFALLLSPHSSMPPKKLDALSCHEPGLRKRRGKDAKLVLPRSSLKSRVSLKMKGYQM